MLNHILCAWFSEKSGCGAGLALAGAPCVSTVRSITVGDEHGDSSFTKIGITLVNCLGIQWDGIPAFDVVDCDESCKSMPAAST
jgi:hypothetical protein